VRAAIVSLVRDPEVKRYFERREGRRILREQEMTNAAGALYRADRIVVDTGEVTVIDFKTGGDEHEAEYVVQVSEYMAMIRDIYPDKKVSGLLAYVDLIKTRSIP